MTVDWPLLLVCSNLLWACLWQEEVRRADRAEKALRTGTIELYARARALEEHYAGKGRRGQWRSL